MQSGHSEGILCLEERFVGASEAVGLRAKAAAAGRARCVSGLPAVGGLARGGRHSRP